MNEIPDRDDDWPVLANFLGDRYSENVRYHGVSAAESEYHHKEFDGCVFQACDLQSTVFRDCLFEDVRFRNCNLSLTQFTGTTLQSCAFRSCKLTGIDWTLAQWSLLPHEMAFRDCLLDFCIFFQLSLRNWVFDSCSVREADFAEAVLAECRFPRSDLSGTRFRRTNFRRAHMEGAYNFGIDVLENEVEGAFFSLPEAVSLIENLGIVLVDHPAGQADAEDE